MSSIDAGAGAALPGPDGSVPPYAAAGAAFSCLLNSDCVQKDVGNCCGYYPRCANVGAVFAAPNCNAGQVGVCGFPAIDHCECQASKCVEVLSLQPTSLP